MNELIEIAKEVTRLWHEHSKDPYIILKKMGYSRDNIKTVVMIMKEANNNMMEDKERERTSSGSKWID